MIDALSIRMPRRILVVAELYGRGGTETHALQLCRLLVSAGVVVTVATRYFNPDVPLVQSRKNIPIRFVTTPFARNRRWFRLSTIWAFLFWRFQMGREMDVIYTFGVSRFHQYLRRYLRDGGRVLWNPAGEPMKLSAGNENAIDRVCELVSNGVVDEMIVETDIQAEAAQRTFGPRRISVMPHIGHYYDSPKRKPVKNGQVFRISFLGRWEKAKGIYHLLDVWPGLEISPAELHYYGGGPDQRNLESEIARRGLTDSVHLHGPWLTSAELAVIFDGTDLLVLPSESEGLPLILLEAMAYGVPFVATDVGGIRSLQRDNPDVLVIPKGASFLAEGIRSMSRRIQDGTVSGSRLQEYFQKRFAREILTEQWRQLFLCDHSTEEPATSTSETGCRS